MSRAFLQAYKADKLRSVLLKNSGIAIVDFQNDQVFPGVGITTCIVFLSRKSQGSDLVVDQLKPGHPAELPVTSEEWDKRYERIVMPFKSLSASPWEIAAEETTRLNQKIDKAGTALGEILTIGQGMQTGCNGVFGSKSLEDISRLKLTTDTVKVRARNSDILRYEVRNSGEYLIYPEEKTAFTDLPEATREYLTTEKKKLKARAAFVRGNCEWWKYTWPLHKDLYSSKRIVCPYLATENRFAIAPSNTIGLTDTTVIFDGDQKEDIRYILALLNSRLLTFRFSSIGKMKGGGVIEYFWNSVSKLPIRRINFSKAADKSRHDQIVKLIDRLMNAKEQAAKATDSIRQDHWQRQCVTLDSKIEDIVTDLYGLNAEEAIIVNANRP